MPGDDQKLQGSPAPAAGAAGLPRAAAWAALVERPGGPVVAGWIVDPDRGPFDSVRVVLDGVVRGEARAAPSPGLGRDVPWIRGAPHAGFTLPLDADEQPPVWVELIASRGGSPAARHVTMFSSPLSSEAPVPPPSIASPSSELAKRTGPDGDPGEIWERDFRAGGMTSAAGLLEQIRLRLDGPAGLRLLDWGCGCGRVARHLLGQGFDSVSGCDLDSAAVGWCRENLPEGRFETSATDPPLPFDDESFDVIVGCSVMTHLDSDRQAQWLDELRRVTSPGGLVMLSTQGETAYRRGAMSRLSFLRRVPSLARLAGRAAGARLSRRGFVDRGAKRELSGIAPDGYYRAVAQTPDYTRVAWADHLEVLDVLERGLDGHQDLVVMRRPR